MSQPAEVKISRAVGKNMIKVQVSKSFGQSEQLNAEMDVPLTGAKDATNFMYENVIRPRALSYIRETVEYQLEQDLMAYEVTEREVILAAANETAKNVKNKRKELEQKNG